MTVTKRIFSYITIILLIIGTCAFIQTDAMAENIKFATLTPPIPASQYKTPYKESTAGQMRLEVVVNGKTRNYQAYIPGEPDHKRAMVFLLHGAGRTGASLVERWKIFADMNDLVLIGPHSNGRSWVSVDETPYMTAVLKDSIKTFNIDINRMYLFGHSDGAVAALHYGPYFSEVFAAMGIHAGQLASNTNYKALEKTKRKIPLVVINGTDDPIFKLDPVIFSAETFAAYGHPTALYILEGHNHWYYTISDYINAIAWDFMKQYHL